jgi:tetratricopeptide (TPR) repeat protein
LDVYRSQQPGKTGSLRRRFDALNINNTQPLEFLLIPGGREMGLIDSMQDWLGGRQSRGSVQPCPPEADILNYQENHLPAKARVRLEQHFAACQDCRELLVLLVRFPAEEIAQQPPLSNAEIQQQTARVIQLVEASERRKAVRGASNQPSPAPQPVWVFRYWAQLATAAVMVCALVIGGLYLMRREPVTESARQSLALAMKDERRSAARLSGGFDYSPYRSTKGSDDSPDFHLKLAVNQLKSAESDNAPVEMRQMLARAHLAFDRPEHARQAQAILESLIGRNVQTAEVFNDLGVAQFQLQRHDEAIASFSRALEINPAYTEALFNRALAKESAMRYSEAKPDWEQFINSPTDAKWKAEAERRLTAR